MLILCSFPSKGCDFLSCALGTEATPEGLDNDGSDVVVVQVVEEPIRASNNNITMSNRVVKYLHK